MRAQRSISELESHLGYCLRRVSNSVSGQFAQSLHVRQTSVAEWVLLRHLYERQQATPGELAEASTMTRGAISKIVDKLRNMSPMWKEFEEGVIDSVIAPTGRGKSFTQHAADLSGKPAH